MKKMEKARELAVRQVGEANVKLMEVTLNEIFDAIFHEIRNKRPDDSWDDYILWRAHEMFKLDTASGTDKKDKSIFSGARLYLFYKCKDDKLRRRILNADKYVMRYIRYLLREALLTLGKRLAWYFEDKLGFPHRSLLFRYDFAVRNNNNVFDKYVFALYARRDLKEGDSIGDWIVLSNEKFDLRLRNKTTGIEWEFKNGIDFMYRPYIVPKLMFYENPEHLNLFKREDYLVYESRTGKYWTLYGIMEAIRHIQMLPNRN